MSDTEQQTSEVKSKGGRPKSPPPPTTAEEVRQLMAQELVKTTPDRFRVQGLSRLLDSFESQEKNAETAASRLLPTVTEERDALLVKVAELEPLAAKAPELEKVLAEQAQWKEEQVKSLVASAQAHEWKAARSEAEAAEKLREADNKVSASGWTELRSTLADLIARHSVPMPSFWETPATMPSAFWELWGWSPTKAKVYTAFKVGYKEPTEAWRQHFLAHLKRTLPLRQFAGMEQPAPISDLSERIAAMTEQAQHWGVWPEIEREFERLQVERQADYLREHYAMMQAQSNDAALRGEGRTPIGEAEPVSITGYTGEHPPECACPNCNGIPAHLRPFEVVEPL